MVGPQTAMVVGKAGEEIWTDKYGRVKVHFHWDRYGKGDEQSSCWIRVAQTWAGKNWGQIQIPRIGQEVLVDFLGGDPDRPIIVGSVYNGSTMPPYDLPANATQSGIKTRSTKGGNASNFNEIRFEDEKGSEELYMHAEKDYNSMVENCLSETIGNNKTTRVGASHSESIGANMQVTVGGSLTESVMVNVAESVGVAMELTVGAFYAETIGAKKTESVGGDKSESIGGNHSESVGKNRTLTVTDDSSESIAKNRNLSVEKDNNVSINGKSTIGIEKELSLSAKKIQFTADDEISFKTGKAMITMKKNGDITLKGKKITVKGSGDVIIKGSKIKEN
jgi:type VI secretion system secreted protein VgrG